MKYTNPGITSNIILTGAPYEVVTDNKYSKTGLSIRQTKNGISNIEVPVNPTKELWAKLDYYMENAGDYACYMYFSFIDESGKTVAKFGTLSTDHKVSQYLEAILYGADKTALYKNETDIFHYRVLKTLEFHIKTGDDGIFEVWEDNKLLFSFDTSAFSGNIAKFAITRGNANYNSTVYYSSFILQDTGRIGLEEFKMLTVTPSDAQTIDAGGSVNFTVGGLADFKGSNQIKSLGFIAKTKNDDATITKGTVKFNDVDFGELDLTSSVETYNQCVKYANYNKSDIEGKTVTLSVDGG